MKAFQLECRLASVCFCCLLVDLSNSITDEFNLQYFSIWILWFLCSFFWHENGNQQGRFAVSNVTISQKSPSLVSCVYFGYRSKHISLHKNQIIAYKMPFIEIQFDSCMPSGKYEIDKMNFWIRNECQQLTNVQFRLFFHFQQQYFFRHKNQCISWNIKYWVNWNRKFYGRIANVDEFASPWKNLKEKNTTFEMEFRMSTTQMSSRAIARINRK